MIRSERTGVTTSKKGWYDWRRHPYSTKDRASQLVRRAIDRGDKKRPSKCSRCGRRDPKRSDGRSAIFAHHHRGSGKPLSVRWLCATCHNRSHSK